MVACILWCFQTWIAMRLLFCKNVRGVPFLLNCRKLTVIEVGVVLVCLGNIRQAAWLVDARQIRVMIDLLVHRRLPALHFATLDLYPLIALIKATRQFTPQVCFMPFIRLLVPIEIVVPLISIFVVGKRSGLVLVDVTWHNWVCLGTTTRGYLLLHWEMKVADSVWILEVGVSWYQLIASNRGVEIVAETRKRGVVERVIVVVVARLHTKLVFDWGNLRREMGI